MSFKKRSLLALVAMATAGVALVPACSNGPATPGVQASNKTGNVDLALTTGGETFTSVNMVITGPQNISRLINVSSANATITAFVGQVLAGAYTVTMTATAASTDSCTGSAAFTVTPGGFAHATVPIVCNAAINPATGRGSATIDAGVTNQSVCPYISSFVVDPVQTDLGSTIAVSGSQLDPGGGAGTGTWTYTTNAAAAALGAGLNGTGDTAGLFTCLAPGAFTVTATLTKTGTPCTATVSTTVHCVGVLDAGPPPPPPPPPPPAGQSACTTGTSSGAVCQACEQNNCTHDPVNQPYCQDLTGTVNPGGTLTNTAACQTALDCMRNTNCLADGAVACYCGRSTPIGQCKNNAAQPGGNDATLCPGGVCGASVGAHGLCINEITAANPTGSNPNAIFSNIGIVTVAGGAATSLAQCDYSNCSPVNGVNDCVPYCK